MVNYLELKKVKKKERILNLINILNVVDLDNKKKNTKYFIYINNYNYNFNFLIGEILFKSKGCFLLKNNYDKIYIKLNLYSPILYMIYRI